MSVVPESRPRTLPVLIAYTALRLLLFVVPFLAIWALSGNPTLSAVLAAVIGLSLSVVLLGGQRSAVGGLIAQRVERRRPTTDESVEDGALDAPPRDAQMDSSAATPKP